MVESGSPLKRNNLTHLSLSFTEHIDIEMGRLITGSKNPTVLYVSGGNTQVIFICY